ncbi:NUDIX hydrolase [Heyndrickxia sp. NPDC080065]|uniref:NUDIX hydrolase n=1 Tax=Heyndrickxia sp. NPDC080065 TaxID=3390568 RepID=UPI003CFD6851
MGLIFKDKFILLEEQEGKHSKGIGYYYRPIGGTIEFGEKSDETLAREFKEELGVEIVINRYISCLENIFKIDENVGHEITQIYAVNFKNENLYEKEFFTVSEGDKVTYAKWVPIEELITGQKVFYPNGLTDLIKEVIV